MGTLGAYLKSAREARGLDIRDAAQHTRISINYLKSLENEDFSKLPGEVFVKGFLKNYARFLNLTEEEVMKRYAELKPQPAATAAAPAAEPEQAAPAPEPKKAAHAPLEPFIWGVVIVIALVMFIFTSMPGKHPEPEQAAPTTPAAPLPGQPETGTARQPKPEKLYLDIVALEDMWVLVRTDASPQKKAVLKKGETITWSADERFLLSYSSVGAAKLVLNGKELAVNGPRNVVVRDLAITASGIALQKFEAEPPRPKKPKPQPQPQAQPQTGQPQPPAQQPPAPEAPPAPSPAEPPPAAPGEQLNAPPQG